MFKRFSTQHLFYKIEIALRRYGFVALCIALSAAIFWISAPVWAAPVARPLNQTVPRPTPTSEGDPLATATPQPDDEDDDNDGDNGENNESENTGSDPNAPNIDFPQAPNGSTGAALTALAVADGLNLREGPGAGFNTLGNIPAGTEVAVLARNEDGSWWYICCIPNTQTAGWASAQLLEPNFDPAQATTLLPLFSAELTAPAAGTTPQPQTATQEQAQGAKPLHIDFQLSPYFVWQGITATLTITVNNPNNVDATHVLLSDELPLELTLVEATTDANGTVDTVTTAAGRPLLLFRWESIPAGASATATLVAVVTPNLANGDVIDNLVAARAAKLPYSTSAVTIGMPPVFPPDFQ